MRRNSIVSIAGGVTLSATFLLAGCVASPVKPAPSAPATTIKPSTTPGCGLATAAFCETFEGPRNQVGNRNGDLSVARFSLARWRSELGSVPGHVDRAGIPACRAGSQANPLPPGDSLICDPTSAIQSHYALTSTAAQNYGDNSYRIAQPFDIANRTGIITFDASLHVDDALLGFATLAFTSDPYSAPSYLADNSAGPTPRQGVQIHFNSVCPGPSGWTAFPKVRTYERHRETLLSDENGFASWCTSNIRTAAGRLNRVQVRLSRTHIEIWATDASSDGVRFGALKKVFSAPMNLGFTRGNVYFGSHNHATDKYGGIPSWTVLWDNIGFDGPVVPAQRATQVNDAAAASGGGVNLGYSLPNSAGGGATPALALANVSISGASTARLVFNMAADPITNSNWSAWRVNYRLNGGAWHAVAITADEMALMNRAGSYIFSVDVGLAELRNGANTVQFSGTNIYAGFQPYIGNIDLVVQ
jgi:hypothetical protein